MLYDADCSLCTAWVRRFEHTLTRHGFAVAPLQDWNSDNFDLREMRVVTPGGTFGGADGIIEIARRIWWGWPLYVLAQIPGVTPLLRMGYRWLAANRHCIGGECRIQKETRLLDWLPLFALPIATFLFRDALPPWLFMWALAFALYAGCKWLTFAIARRKLEEINPVRSFGYLFAWPGMDATAFLSAPRKIDQPIFREWIFATAKIPFGSILLWFGAPFAARHDPLVAGWIGMVGIMFCLHFGLFDLLALAWRAAGVNATPLMRNPVLARSLAEFWGKRWNTAFHELVHRFLFRPVLRRTNALVATLTVFLASGLIHDLVISIPARGGYGLPTVYFLIQGAGMLIERSPFGRRLGLGRGACGWLFAVIVIAGPAFWLFHPPFIRTVILPMLHAIGAT